MTIAVTGATGQLGRLIVAGLREQVPADEIVAVVRDPAKAGDLAVPVRTASYEDETALISAFAGVDVLVFVSASEPSGRVGMHTNVVRAAQAAGVGRVVYTSATHADDTSLVVAPDHRATEQLLRDSGLAWTFLRNNWYHENYAGTLALADQTREVVSAAGAGRVASASRDDYAAAAVVVATTPGHEGTVYELGGDEAWDFPELARVAADVLGHPVAYRAVSLAARDSELAAPSVDEGTRAFLVTLEGNIADGDLAEVTHDLSRLIERPTTPLATTLTALR